MYFSYVVGGGEGAQVTDVSWECGDWAIGVCPFFRSEGPAHAVAPACWVGGRGVFIIRTAAVSVDFNMWGGWERERNFSGGRGRVRMFEEERVYV